MPEITISEWKEALDNSYQNDPGKTACEISSEIGLGKTQTKVFISKMVKNGSAKRGMATRIDIIGRPQNVPVYEFIKKNKPNGS